MKSNSLALPASLPPLLLLLLFSLLPSSLGHGRLLEPPSRQSAWRFGFKTPVNYDDHALYCGGRGNQWDVNNGACGICGDPAQGPRWYERPDGLAVQHDVKTRTYTQAQGVDVRVGMTVNHLGWFEFRLCDIATVGGVEATQECLDRNLLANTSGHTRFEVATDRIGNYDYFLYLPDDVTCEHCMMQWKWHAGNSPGYGEEQEEFYGCSDVNITARDGSFPAPHTPTPAAATTTSSSTTTPLTTPLKTTPSLTTTTTPASTTTSTTTTAPSATTTTVPTTPSPTTTTTTTILPPTEPITTTVASPSSPSSSQPDVNDRDDSDDNDNDSNRLSPRVKPPTNQDKVDVFETHCKKCRDNGCSFFYCPRICQHICP